MLMSIIEKVKERIKTVNQHAHRYDEIHTYDYLLANEFDLDYDEIEALEECRQTNAPIKSKVIRAKISKSYHETKYRSVMASEYDEHNQPISRRCLSVKKTISTSRRTKEYQAELDKYFKNILEDYSSKGKKARGTLYERYIGYCFEAEGVNVEYRGINCSKEGKGDGGIDLICRHGNYTFIVQCKNYFDKFAVAPKDVLALQGTIDLYLKGNHNPAETVLGIFFATSRFSDIAKDFGYKLGLELQEGKKLFTPFPIIKCKLSDDGKSYYYLPTDSQYDDITLDLGQGDCYCQTVAETEVRGFRRYQKTV